MTKDDLEKKVWWWRWPTADRVFDPVNHTTQLREDSKDTTWKQGMEAATWRYELMRRHVRDENLPPFPELDSVMQDDVARILGPVEKVIRSADTNIVYDLDVYDDKPWFNPNIELNLSAPRSAVHRAIDQIMRAESIRRGITERDAKPKDGKKVFTKRKRGISWWWPELMDLSYFKLEILNESERSVLTRARRHAKEINKYWTATILQPP